jgi:hypothetical protein
MQGTLAASSFFERLGSVFADELQLAGEKIDLEIHFRGDE